MAREFTIKDTMHLYPILQAIARYDETDAGDINATESAPYKISANDIDTYVAVRNFSLIPSKFFGIHTATPYAVTLNDKTLNPLEMTELYRQLARYDKADGDLDGSIGADQMEQPLFLPAAASSVSFWGNDWTPAKRLSVYARFFGDRIEGLTNRYKSSDFPLGRAYAAGVANSPSNAFRLRKLYLSKKKDADKKEDTCEEKNNKGEKKYICEIASAIEGKNPEYANLIREAMPKTRVLEAFIMSIEEKAEIEPTAFGLTPLFNEEDNGTYLIIYPQFGQKTIDAKRSCTDIQTKKGWEFKCLSRVGSHSRQKAEKILLAYMGGRTLKDWSNIRLYLSMARFRSIFRYAQDLLTRDEVRQKILHEYLHYRNPTKPAECEEFSIPQLVDMLNKFHEGRLTSYNDCHKLGYFLTHIQRITFEESERLRQEAKNGIHDEEYTHFINQLYRLANEAEENLADYETWKAYYGDKKLKLQPWVFGENEKAEKKLIFNPNEIEIVKRQQ